MDLVIFTSLLHAAIFAIAVLGAAIFWITPAYRGICLLLALISLSTLFNLLEDLQISRSFYLVSPIFILGVGPAFYFAARRLIVGFCGYRAYWHFLPMLLALPFTAHPQAVIAVGTVWRIAYALLTLRLIVQFNRYLTAQRSDAREVSLVWLAGLVGVSAMFGAADLLRLNFQLELGQPLNTLGYAVSTSVSFIILFLLVLILTNRRAGLETLAGSLDQDTSLGGQLDDGQRTDPVAPETNSKKPVESAADYQSLFAILDREMRAHAWYCQPRLTLNQLSALSGLGTRDISRSINLVAGASFNDYVNQFRVEYVMHQLRVSRNNNLIDLALAAGFSSKATFNQSFRKATGMTPSEFRCAQLPEAVQDQDSRRSLSRD